MWNFVSFFHFFFTLLISFLVWLFMITDFKFFFFLSLFFYLALLVGIEEIIHWNATHYCIQGELLCQWYTVSTHSLVLADSNQDFGPITTFTNITYQYMSDISKGYRDLMGVNFACPFVLPALSCRLCPSCKVLNIIWYMMYRWFHIGIFTLLIPIFSNES